ncbi:iron complex transport system substrate-binding protein [Chromohalobacter marismortui]|uniref:Iron complex transport system substrate-binding protein n=1 Tax=Chromohalobacter marismortui TaxID=42055 RepID=A0A4R7NRQ4_9GAMM|nr:MULTISPECIES: ABC transporter substrate-binding protein [Chromohalobacter]MCI0592380.1 ABC transporter substrate-binding protein [Chromohalobacter sp.]TDU23557.1 iron complex transport system substrate-binding protein [Chromohalobacter marismortui]
MKHHHGIAYRSIAKKCILLSTILFACVLIGNASMASDEGDEVSLATFDFAIAETLNALGHPPTFISGLQGYETYSRQPGIIPSSINLGYRHLPNLELLASDPPKYILISPPAHVSLIPKLRKIATVKEYPLYKNYDGKSHKSHWQIIEELTRELGRLTADPTAAEKYISQTNKRFDELKKHLKDVSSPLLIVRLMDERHARVYGHGSVEGMVLKRLGLENAWKDKLGKWGLATVSAKALLPIDAKVIFLDSPYDPPGGQERILNQGLWKHWPSIKRNDYAILSLDYWSWGGFPSARRFAESLADCLPHSPLS